MYSNKFSFIIFKVSARLKTRNVNCMSDILNSDIILKN